MQEQNYKNHGRMVTGFHYVLFAIIVVTFIMSLINLYQEIQAGEGLLESLMFIFLTISVLLVAWYARAFALKAQDRGIRAEENFRHYVLTGKPLDSSLKMGQIIALRFASDSEFVTLAQKAVEENLGGKDIKQLIQNWKADNHRV
jgi:ammonia channel protein AmtB